MITQSTAFLGPSLFMNLQAVGAVAGVVGVRMGLEVGRWGGFWAAAVRDTPDA